VRKFARSDTRIRRSAVHQPSKPPNVSQIGSCSSHGKRGRPGKMVPLFHVAIPPITGVEVVQAVMVRAGSECACGAGRGWAGRG
jgi:hypothetical protein